MLITYLLNQFVVSFYSEYQVEQKEYLPDSSLTDDLDKLERCLIEAFNLGFN